MRSRLLGVGLILLGSLGVFVGGGAYLEAWVTAHAWDQSTDQELELQADAPPPRWIGDATPASTDGLSRLPTSLRPATPEAPAPLGLSGPVPTPPVASVDDLGLVAVAFRFRDPPEPDAHAQLVVTLHNASDLPTGDIVLAIPGSWFDSYRVLGAIPPVSRDQLADDGQRGFTFPGLRPGEEASLALQVIAIGEDIRPPHVSVRLATGETIGEATPETEAPRPRPGPVMALDIPRLALHARVLPTAWEPPPFIIGQIRGTANVTQGNTVLVGHLTGAAGNVFAHLNRLEPGDTITATSRGLPYAFVVSRVFTGPNTDSSPIQATDTPRLTLMTCAGIWNPFTRDYSERLWVIAEPPDQAAETIAADAAAAAASATATAISAEPTETPTEVPAEMPTDVPTEVPTAVAAPVPAEEAAVAPTASIGSPNPGQESASPGVESAAPATVPGAAGGAAQPAPAGGLGNTRADLQAAFGPPLGETPAKLVVYRAGGVEYHVEFTPEPSRAVMLVEFPAKGASLSFEAAVHASRRFFPLDTQPRTGGPEGNDQFVVERFSSPSLADAVGDSDFVVVYARDRQGTISRIILGVGDDIDALLDRSIR